jgi:uncharacterized protein (DUF1800 family)
MGYPNPQEAEREVLVRKRDTSALSMSLEPYTSWTEREAVHLLKRCHFGAVYAEVQALMPLGLEGAVELLLEAPFEEPAPPINFYTVLDSEVVDNDVPAGDTWVDAPYNPALEFWRGVSVKTWLLERFIDQPLGIREKMMLFWHNHFAVETRQSYAHLVYRHFVMLRGRALGNFKELTKAITLDPSMLVYLNGYLNTAEAPDENYARELQELFTLGKGPEAKFTEDDVKAAARILTGYTINLTTGEMYFDPTKHDTGNKQLSSFYNNALIPGRTGDAGQEELDELLDYIFAKEEVSKFLCRKLYRFFVHYDLSPGVEENIITPLAALFRQSNYEIKPVLRKLLLSKHFFDSEHRGAFIKTPLDQTVGAVREFGLQFPPSENLAVRYSILADLLYYNVVTGLDLADPPSVSGWPAYYQKPVYHRLWINSDSLPKRTLLVTAICFTWIQRDDFTLQIDFISYLQSLSNPADPNALIEDLTKLLLAYPVSFQVKGTLKAILLSGTFQDYYWTDAWETYLADPSPMNQNTVLSRIQPVIAYLVNLPEYQLA